MPQIEFRGLQVAFRQARSSIETVAIEDLSFTVEAGEFVTVVGPSGCGKSTALMVLDGLQAPTAGQVVVEGKPVTGPGPDRAVVFQEFALLPWRSVLDNVCFGLEFKGVAAAERHATAQRYVELVGLRGFEQHYPNQLSGGMRQRVGIARALAVNPKILLMDEPFGALDAQTREVMGSELLKIWDREKKTVVFITHDIDESLFLADRVVVMTARPGRVKEIVQVPFPRPRSPELRNTAEFAECRRRIWETLQDEVQRTLAGETAR